MRAFLAGLVAIALISTGASAQSGGATLPSAFVLLSCQTPSGTGVVTFSSVTQAYNHLQLEINGASTTAGTGTATVNVTFNGDSGANYNSQFLFGFGTTVGASQGSAANAAYGGDVPTAGDIANVPGNSTMLIPFYTNTSFYKDVRTSVAKNPGATFSLFASITSVGYWANTAAITSLTATLSSGNWVSGSKVCLNAFN